MSSALAIASITAVLKDLLDNRLVQRNVADTVGNVMVSAIPPDRIPVGAEEHTRLNLFLYRVTPHIQWQRSGLDAPARDGLDPSPFALDLHFLLTAYGEHDFEAEMLLGYAVQLLHETPRLTRDAIDGGLSSISRNNANGLSAGIRAALSSATLPDQVESIEIRPVFLSMEETSKLWSSLQARYRPSVTYQISVVMIEGFR